MGSACVCVWQGKGCVWEETADFRKRAAVLAQLSSILSRGGKILKHHKKTSLFINPKPNWTLGSGFLTTKAQIYRAPKAPRRPESMNKWTVSFPQRNWRNAPERSTHDVVQRAVKSTCGPKSSDFQTKWWNICTSHTSLYLEPSGSCNPTGARLCTNPRTSRL